MGDARKMVSEFMKERGWDKQLPDHVAKSITIEAAELLELFQWANPSVADLKNNPEKLSELKGELADVFIYSIQMALILGLDIDEIVTEKLKFADKKYPSHLMKLRSEGDSLATREYLEIKKIYRRNRKTK